MGNSESVVVGSPAHSPQYNGHRVSKRIEDDFVDLGNDTESFSQEQMEDQFAKIVVSEQGGMRFHIVS